MGKEVTHGIQWDIKSLVPDDYQNLTLWRDLFPRVNAAYASQVGATQGFTYTYNASTGILSAMRADTSGNNNIAKPASGANSQAYVLLKLKTLQSMTITVSTTANDLNGAEGAKYGKASFNIENYTTMTLTNYGTAAYSRYTASGLFTNQTAPTKKAYDVSNLSTITLEALSGYGSQYNAWMTVTFT